MGTLGDVHKQKYLFVSEPIDDTQQEQEITQKITFLQDLMLDQKRAQLAEMDKSSTLEKLDTKQKAMQEKLNDVDEKLKTIMNILVKNNGKQGNK